MNSIRKIFMYAVAFVASFSLTAISCEDVTEDLSVDIPTQFNRTIKISSDEAGNVEMSEILDLTSDEYKENRKKFEKATIEEVTFTVADNLSTGSAIPTNTEFMMFNPDGNSIAFEPSPGTLQEQFDELISALDQDMLDFIDRVYIAGTDEPSVTFRFRGITDGPVDYTITMTIKGTLEVSAN